MHLAVRDEPVLVLRGHWLKFYCIFSVTGGRIQYLETFRNIKAWHHPVAVVPYVGNFDCKLCSVHLFIMLLLFLGHMSNEVHRLEFGCSVFLYIIHLFVKGWLNWTVDIFSQVTGDNELTWWIWLEQTKLLASLVSVVITTILLVIDFLSNVAHILISAFPPLSILYLVFVLHLYAANNDKH